MVDQDECRRFYTPAKPPVHSRPWTAHHACRFLPLLFASFLPTRPDDPSPARVPGPTDPLLSRWISWRFPESHPSAVTSTQGPGAGLGSALWSGGSRRSLIRARVDGFGVASSVSAVGNHAAANFRAPVSTRAFISRVRTPGPSPGAGGRLTF